VFVIVRFRVPALFCLLALVLNCSFVAAQIRLAARQPAQAQVHPEDAPTLALDLCVDGSTTYPCPNPVIDDTTYVPSITLTYGQILDGVVRSSANTGTISIYRSGLSAPICVLQIGIGASCPPASTIFDAGDYTLTATLTLPPSTSVAASAAPVMVSVFKDASSVAITSSQPIAPLGSPVTITATVLGSYGEAASGQVGISVDGGASQLYTLDGTGAASFTTSTLAIGKHPIVATYAGSIDFDAAAVDAQFQQTIVPQETVTTLTSSLNPSVLGQNVTFTATVTSVAAGVHPKGMVNFNDGTWTFATTPVTAQGIAQVSIATLTTGTHNITAYYQGDASTGPSSVVLVPPQQVDPPPPGAMPGFTVTVTPSPVVLGVGLTANLTVTVTPTSGFSEPVTLTCGNLPHESTCTFVQSVIPAGGGTTTLDLYVSSPHDCGSTSPYFYGANRPGPRLLHSGFRYGGPALAGVLLLLLPNRRWRKGMLALCVAVSLTGLSGCSSACTDFGTYPGSYTFQVIGTAPAAITVTANGSGTPVVVQTSVAVTVKI
jgi:hypothetical protein